MIHANTMNTGTMALQYACHLAVKALRSIGRHWSRCALLVSEPLPQLLPLVAVLLLLTALLV